MKKLIALFLCLCLTASIVSVVAETAAEAPKTEMTAEELYQAGEDAFLAEDYGKAMEYYLQAAEAGNAGGWRSVGFLYDLGLGVEQDYAKALEYYTLAAEKDVPEAMFALGDFCYEGFILEKDADKAAEWYRKALDAGYEPEEEDQARLKEVLGDDYAQEQD